jgi:hypothetical protein
MKWPDEKPAREALKPRRKRTKSGPCGGELPNGFVFDDVETEVPGLDGVLVEDVSARDLQACRGEIVLIVPHGVAFNERARFDRDAGKLCDRAAMPELAGEREGTSGLELFVIGPCHGSPRTPIEPST